MASEKGFRARRLSTVVTEVPPRTKALYVKCANISNQKLDKWIVDACNEKAKQYNIGE